MKGGIRKQAVSAGSILLTMRKYRGNCLQRLNNGQKKKAYCIYNGPLGFTDMDGEGTLVEGFEELSTLGAIYNYPYYPSRIEAAGFEKDADWVEYQLTVTSKFPERG